MKAERWMGLDLAREDDRPPQIGDIVRTARAQYVVIESREVDSRVWWNRWRVRLRLDPDADKHPEPGARLFPTSSYRRGETPASHFGEPGPVA